MDGSILKMEFLHPPRDSSDHVSLLLVVSKERKTRLILYEWDSTSDIRNAERKGPGTPIPENERLPLLLIPLTFAAAFMLVYEHSVTVYRGILSGSASAHYSALSHSEDAEESSSSSHQPLWTQWARPMRHEQHQETRDRIYLCREDGVVRYLEASTTRHGSLDSSHRAGVLKVNVNTAFASIDLGSRFDDLLVAGGDMCDGGSWFFQPRNPSAHHFATLPNWTPVTDMEIMPATENDSTDGRFRAASQRLFACTGRGVRHGAITEFRYGTRATKSGATVDLGAAAQKAVLDMWAFTDSTYIEETNGAAESDKGVLLLISYISNSELIFLPAGDADPYSIDADIGFNLDGRTLAAGSTTEGYLVQVTSQAVRATSLKTSTRPYTSSGLQSMIVAACIQRVPTRTTLLLTVTKINEGFKLHQGHFGTKNGSIAYEELGDTLDLQGEPVCVSVHWVFDHIVAFVGTLDGKLQVFQAEPGLNFLPAYEYSFESDLAVCDSIAFISSNFGYNLIVCGLRSGEVQVLKFTANDSGGFRYAYSLEYMLIHAVDVPILSFWDKLSVGTTVVRVRADKTKASRVILTCEETLYALEYPEHFGLRPPPMLNRIWIADHSSTEFHQGRLNCVTQADSWITPGCSGFGVGSIFFMSGTQLFTATLSDESEPCMVPRHLPLKGTPTRVMYSQRLKRLIVLYSVPVVKPIREKVRVHDHGSASPLRGAQSMITCLDPDLEKTEHGSDNQRVSLLPDKELRAGERFLGIIEWFPTADGKEYHILVLCTMIERSPSHESNGRLLLLSPSTEDSGLVNFHIKKELVVEAPVWAVASFGSSSLIYACGDDLVIRKLDMTTKKFSELSRIRLRSRGTRISVEGAFIYVATAAHSLSIFKIKQQNLVLEFGDAVERPGIRHLNFHSQSMILISDMSCRLASLWQPPQSRIDKSAPTIFEANLSQSVTRFGTVRRPLWHQKFPTVSTETVIGSSTDGTVYQFSVIDEDSWMLLRFIQNLAMRNRLICSLQQPNVRERHIEPNKTKKHYMQVDGDILNRLLNRGGKSLLAKMLSEKPDASHQHADFSTTADRQARFEELVTAVFGTLGSESLVVVIDWIRVLLLPVL